MAEQNSPSITSVKDAPSQVSSTSTATAVKRAAAKRARLLAKKRALQRKQDLDERELRLLQEKEWMLLETELEAQEAELAIYEEYESDRRVGVLDGDTGIQSKEESVKNWLEQYPSEECQTGKLSKSTPEIISFTPKNPPVTDGRENSQDSDTTVKIITFPKSDRMQSQAAKPTTLLLEERGNASDDPSVGLFDRADNLEPRRQMTRKFVRIPDSRDDEERKSYVPVNSHAYDDRKPCQPPDLSKDCQYDLCGSGYKYPPAQYTQSIERKGLVICNDDNMKPCQSPNMSEDRQYDGRGRAYKYPPAQYIQSIDHSTSLDHKGPVTWDDNDMTLKPHMHQDKDPSMYQQQYSMPDRQESVSGLKYNMPGRNYRDPPAQKVHDRTHPTSLDFTGQVKCDNMSSMTHNLQSNMYPGQHSVGLHGMDYKFSPAQYSQTLTNNQPDYQHSHNGDPLVAILSKLVSYQREATLPPAQVEQFDGDALQYPSFISQFKLLVEETTTIPKRRLDSLLRFTKGDAHNLIKECISLPPIEAYMRARQLLYRDYGNPAILAATYRDKVENWPRIPVGDKQALRKFSVFLTNCCTAKKSNPDVSNIDNYNFLRTLASKLPVAIQQKWIHTVGRCREEEQRSPTLEDFDKFVGHLARDENDLRIAGLGYQGRANKSKLPNYDKPVSQKNAFATVASPNKTNTQKPASKENRAEKNPCLHCGPETHHSISQCRKFSALSPSEKSEVCRKKGLCFGCLNPGHTKAACTNQEWAKCKKCDRKHATALHDPARGVNGGKKMREEGKNENKDKKKGEMKNENRERKTEERVTTGCVNTTNSAPLMTIAPVMVKATTGSQCIVTYAFFDNGCGAVFATEELSRRLNLRSKRTKLCLKTMNLEETIETDALQDKIQISDLEGTSFLELPRAYLRDTMPVGEQDIPKMEDLDKWSHLKDIEIPDISKYPNYIPGVTVMVGSNVPAATQPLETRTGELGDPYAIKSPLGWLVYGVTSKNAEESVSAHFSKVSCDTTIQTSNENLEQMFKEYVNREFEERLEGEVRPSVEDKQFLKIMEETITQEEDGHYSTALPFRDKTTVMPNNHPQAEIFAQRLKKRLMKDSNLHQQYTEFMENLEERGYAGKVPAEELSRTDGRLWYLPHHPVFNPRKPGKIRVVYNCPATFKGHSLNQQLYQGPDLTNRLSGVLLRWRQDPIAVIADIEQMFYQVRVQEDDRDMMRYLWWPNGQLTAELTEYRMHVHIFGAVSSPSCANYALRRMSEDSPKVKEAVLNNFYVDDMLKSFPEEEEAIEVCLDIKNELKKGGFKLTKWASNSRKFLESIPLDDRAKDVKSIDLDYDALPTEGALGVMWNVEEDKLMFMSRKTSKPDQAATRRSILSTIGSIYDPLGIVSPYILEGKIILQALCQKKVNWDEKIPEEEERAWKLWQEQLHRIEEVKLDRCYKSTTLANPQQVQIHHFADASESGYGTVSYMRFVSGTQMHCAFIMAKSRVAPLKKISIPRLELTAATVMVRVNNMLTRELKIQVDSTFFWTDSQTVLKYICNESSRFQTFVANRVEMIRDGSEVAQWRYVPSKLNPADDCSRGLNLEKLLERKTWFQGPDFLWKDSDNWPTTPPVKPGDLPSQDPEVRKPVKVSTVKAEHVKPEDTGEGDHTMTLIRYYSSWTKLRRAVAWWLRLKKNLLARMRGCKVTENQDPRYLTVEDMKEAEIAILKFTQLQSFHKEIQALRSKASEKERRVTKSSNIASLDPVLSDDGLLRVGGRLRNAPITQQAKHPVILPKDSHVSSIIIRHVHETANHQGRNHVLAQLRQQYWIIKACAAVRKLLRNCVICRKYQASIGTQKMTDLPTCRLQPNEPAFSQTGVDYFGPLYVKVGRTTRKRYGVIFTCFSSRAIHLEISESLDTSSCINAIRRFISRRGPVKDMYSDNGTNFVGANSELKSAIKEIKQENMERYATNNGFKWHFNVPAASHHGGAWERPIRTVKKILQAMLSEQHLKVTSSDEQLYTLLCEVEMTVNSRPLTKTSDDPCDLNVITPNHLLQLKMPECVPLGTFNERDIYAKRRWRQVQYLSDLFWKRWIQEYLPTLQKRQKWLQPDRNLQIGDIVLIEDSTAPRNSWPLGVVKEVNVGHQGHVRSATVKTKTATLSRPITKLCLILEAEP